MSHDYRHRKEFQDYAREAQLKFRLQSLRVLLACLFVVYLGCFWYYQVVRADHFRELSDSNHIRISLAVTADTPSICANWRWMA